jgi:transposase
MFMSRDEKERCVIDLYSQGKTYRQIAEEVRISPNDIHTILKKKEEEKNNNAVTNKQQQPSSSLATKAYELLSQGKTLLQVAITLNIKQSEVTKYYKEYCKLKRLHKLYCAYTDLGDEGIGDFLKLHKLSKKEGISRKQVVKLLQLADETNPSGLSQLEKRRKWLIDEIHELDMQIERSKNYLYRLNDEIASAKALLNSYRVLCEQKRQETEDLNNEISRLETLINHFKSDDGEYLKIKKTVEEEVRNVLTDGKVMLQFALAAIIEALRRNPDKYHDLLVKNTLSSITKTIQQSPSWHIENYRNAILDEASRLYDKLLKHFTERIMDNAIGTYSSFDPILSSTFPRPSNQNDTYRKEGLCLLSIKPIAAYVLHLLRLIIKETRHLPNI